MHSSSRYLQSSCLLSKRNVSQLRDAALQNGRHLGTQAVSTRPRTKQSTRGLANSTSPTIPRCPARFQSRAFSYTYLQKDNAHPTPSRSNTTSAQPTAEPNATTLDLDSSDSPVDHLSPSYSPETVVRGIRQEYGDDLPENALTSDEMKMYERLYGGPMRILTREELERERQRERESDTVLLRSVEDGGEEIEILEAVDTAQEVAQSAQEVAPSVKEVAPSAQEVAPSPQEELDEAQEVYEEEDVDEEEEYDEEEDDMEPDVWPGDENAIRTHPLTAAGRFGTNPSTLQLNGSDLVQTSSEILSKYNRKHLAEAAHDVFGGVGLPHSIQTPRRGRSMEQKPIPVSAAKLGMSDVTSNLFLATVMPGTYAAITSALTEVRRRLGATWLRGLLEKEGGPRVLDVGGAGGGVFAWRDILRAEWEVMLEEGAPSTSSSGGKHVGETPPVPFGKSVVLTASSALRYKASAMLDNTTFIPRLPDYSSAEEQLGDEVQTKQFDVIIAVHSLWPLKEEYQRKKYMHSLWKMLSPDGGVLVILEKGVPRGFEVVAAARQMLLDKHISSPGSETYETRFEDPKSNVDEHGRVVKEKGMIIAPCTNHEKCPMFPVPGISRGRKDFCYFKQRYVRPPYLQHILGAKEKNWEDIQFSYVAVMRGKDLRDDGDAEVAGMDGTALQGQAATDRAFAGFEEHPAYPTEKDDTEQSQDEDAKPSNSTEAAALISPLRLPRVLLSPLKRRGHAILDVCTPAGSLERWIVARSWSRQAYRDARKSQWGDLWGLGAKTRMPRNLKLGQPSGKSDLDSDGGSWGKDRKKKEKRKRVKEWRKDRVEEDDE
ncbi:hypothetical protein K402DRAFT_382091 [Aulographum hederae CBS 113979]|uniref:Rsm22-domain-containing protein n=1 Tax=Aulographum hederae CBS 113979 TaxID=1176131 RepID=A0A6G1GSQ7_9PEZI|nr:hypothetical protein K402DRAFT_382091 [Aulographum hederae CBS 113979]